MVDPCLLPVLDCCVDRGPVPDTSDWEFAPESSKPESTEKLTLRFVAHHYTFDEELEKILEEHLAPHGVEVELVYQSTSDYLPALREGDWDITLYGWRLDAPLAGDFLQVLHSRNSETGDSYWNLCGYASKEFDALIEEYETLAPVPSTLDRRTELCGLILELLRDDAPIVPLFTVRDYWITSDRVKLPDMPNSAFNTMRYIEPVE
jgi:ABC-type oligopeptide transport system substrate-binding subunit